MRALIYSALVSVGMVCAVLSAGLPIYVHAALHGHCLTMLPHYAGSILVHGTKLRGGVC